MNKTQKQQLTIKQNSEYYRILVKQHGKEYADEQWANRDPEIVIESLEGLSKELEAEDIDSHPLY